MTEFNDTFEDSIVLTQNIGLSTDINISVEDSFEITDYIELYNIIGDIYQADLYFANKLNGDLWKQSSTTTKIAALTEATQIISALTFEDPTVLVSQPTNLCYACYEEAFSLIKNNDLDSLVKGQSITRDKFGPVETEYANRRMGSNLLSGITSARAWFYLRPYLVDNHQMNLFRAS